jgi:DNA-directed RNA polymerase II subunit RPB1
VVNNWLVNTGFTVGVSDIIAKTEITNQVRETMKEQLKEVAKIIRRTQAGKLETQPGKSMIESFENDVNSALNDARSKAGNIALVLDFNLISGLFIKFKVGALAPDNRLKNMVEAGSKGSNMNIS